jgi:PAS domain S-box-containing protein
LRTTDKLSPSKRREASSSKSRNGTQRSGDGAPAYASSESYYDLIQGLNALVWEADPESLRYVFVSQSAEQILGYPVESWLRGDGQEFWASLIHPEDREHVVRFSLGELNAGRDHEIEYRAIAADGRVVWLREIVRRQTDESGRLCKLCGLMVDTTKCKRAEEKYYNLFDNASMGIYQSAPDGRILTANLTLARLLGYDSHEELLALNMGEHIYFDRDDRERYLTEYRAEAASGVMCKGIEMLWKRRDGTPIWIHLNVRAVNDAEGATLYYDGFVHDITERRHAEEALRESEERFRALVENSTDAVIVLDADGLLIFDNPSRERPLGYTPGEMMGASVFDIIHPEDVARFRRVFEEVVARPGIASRASFRARHRDGTWRHIESTFRSLLDNPAVGGVVVNSRDVTEQTMAEEKLRRSETMSAMGALVAGVAHEVRNPLFSISATIDSFEARFGDRPEYGKYFELLRGELGRMTGLMQELLEYSKPPTLQLAPVPAGKLVARAVRSCAAHAGQRRVRVSNEAARSEATLMADRKRLLQVFQNLLENAIHHSPHGGTVSVSACETKSGGGDWVEFAVEDEGPGFREEDLLQIFEPFFTRRRGGTGLGLSIVQRIVEEHRGQLEAANREGGGARMLVRLPLAVSEGTETSSDEAGA